MIYFYAGEVKYGQQPLMLFYVHVSQGLILSGLEQCCPMKPEPGADGDQDIREQSQVRGWVEGGALAGL